MAIWMAVSNQKALWISEDNKTTIRLCEMGFQFGNWLIFSVRSYINIKTICIQHFFKRNLFLLRSLFISIHPGFENTRSAYWIKNQNWRTMVSIWPVRSRRIPLRLLIKSVIAWIWSYCWLSVFLPPCGFTVIWGFTWRRPYCSGGASHSGPCGKYPVHF